MGGTRAELQQPGPRDRSCDSLQPTCNQQPPHPFSLLSPLDACPAELHCYVSPVLRQMRLSTSKIEAEQWVGACGGAGWIALEVRGILVEVSGGAGVAWERGACCAGTDAPKWALVWLEGHSGMRCMKDGENG